MKTLADRHRIERNFIIGQLVYLRLQPYIQITVGGRRPHKLSPLYFGPYPMLARIGQVAYKLDLPAVARIRLPRFQT